MDRQTIAAGWLTLRPFTPADTPWVYEVSLDPLLQRFMQVPSPYRLEEATLRKRRARHGVRVDEWVGSLLRHEVTADPASRLP